MTDATTATDYRSGKGHRDENFPVASVLIAKQHRGAILAFYNFVRTADDIADHMTLSPDEKLAHLDRLERALLGQSDGEQAGVALRAALDARNLSPQHAQDLLTAFRRDVTKNRTADWDDLIDYCRYSAMPVGRYVLDVHGQDRATWAASDALCAALQIINHLQDCGKDFRDLDRVYIPLDALAKTGATVDMLGAASATPQLRACLHGLAIRTQPLLTQGRPLHRQVDNVRLAMEISVIQTAAERLVEILKIRDPMSERVHLGKASTLGHAMLGVLRALAGRMLRSPPRVSHDARR
jgi:squalene synthase HpnC